jgi:hypothetical protein
MSRPGAVPAIAGLGTAALVAWFACPAPPHRLFTPYGALFTSMLYALSVTAACAAGAFLAAREYSVERLALLIRRLMAIAVWFAPAAIFLAAGASSVQVLVATAALLIAASLWWLDRPKSPPDLAYATGMFSLPHSIRLTRQLPVSIGLALLAELIATLVISDELFPAILLTIAAAAVFWRMRAWSQPQTNHVGPDVGPPLVAASRLQPALFRSKLTGLTTVVAVILILAGLSRFISFGGGSATDGASQGRNDPIPAPPPSGEFETGAGVGEFTGVILIPDAEKHVTLVPPLPSMSSALFRKAEDNPITIPFFGVYWFYQFPATRPPPNSVTLHGKPEDIRFRSMGRLALKMEAHQNLGKLIDVSCCSGIQVAIHNAEHIRSTGDPRGIGRIQLILANTAPRSGPPESLGMQWIDGSEHQVLDFRMRSSVELLQFDELTVRILPEWIATPQSARISIEHFVLLPRVR